MVLLKYFVFISTNFNSEDVMNISFPDVSWENLGEEDIPSKIHTNLVFRTTKQEAIDDTKCIVFEASIKKLLHMAVGGSDARAVGH